MFSIGLTSCPEFDVLVLDPSKLKNESLREMFQTMSDTSPAMAFKFQDEALVNMRSLLGNDIDGVYFELLQRSDKNKKMIYMDARLQDILTPDEYRAVFEHEVGHIRNGDIDKLVNGVEHDEIAAEIAADAAAAAVVGKHAMKSALEKILADMFMKAANAHADEGSQTPEQVASLATKNDQIILRMMALS